MSNDSVPAVNSVSRWATDDQKDKYSKPSTDRASIYREFSLPCIFSFPRYAR